MNRRIVIYSLFLLPLLSACQEYSGEISDGYIKEKADKIEYAVAFEKAFGKIAPNQTWDLTYNREHSYLPAPEGYEQSVTRATLDDGAPFTVKKDEWFYPAELYKAVNDFRYEVDNTPKGVPSAMYTPDKPFSLIPIYQGNCRNMWELHITVGYGADAPHYILYNKVISDEEYSKLSSEDKDRHDASYYEYIQSRPTANAEWQTLYTTVDWSGNGKPSTENPVGNAAGHNWATVEGVRSHEIVFDFEAGTPIFFYLMARKTVPSGNSTYWREESSLNGDMLDVTSYVMSEYQELYPGSNRPSCIGENEQFKIYGMEANLQGNVGESGNGSRDYCDVMFLIKGEEIPEIFKVQETETELKKRYLIEDLAQFDFDFNDIVVDLKQVHKTRFTTQEDTQGNVQIVAFDLDETKQYATIAHQCGTLPLKLFIGDYQMPGPEEGEEYIYPGKGGGPKGSSGWDPTEDELGEDFAAHYHNIQLPETNPWMPGENNIIVKVKQAGSETTNGSTIYYNSINYPKDGEAPMIIAVPAGTEWMPEMIQITPQYFPEPALKETNS